MDIDGRQVSVLTLDQVAERLQVSRSTVRRMVREGRLRVIHVGTGRGHPRVTEREFAAYMASVEGRKRR